MPRPSPLKPPKPRLLLVSEAFAEHWTLKNHRTPYFPCLHFAGVSYALPCDISFISLHDFNFFIDILLFCVRVSYCPEKDYFLEGLKYVFYIFTSLSSAPPSAMNIVGSQ